MWLVLGVLALLALGAAYAGRRALVEWGLRAELARRGLEPVALTIGEVGAGGLAVRDVRIGDDDLVLRELDLGWSLATLRSRRLDALRIHGLRVRGVLGEDGISLGALDALRGGAGETASGPPRFPVLPTARLEVEEASVVLETAHGPVVATLAVHLDEAGDGRVALAATALPALDTALGIAVAPFALGGSISFRPDRLHLELDPAPFSLTRADGAGTQRIEGETPAIVVTAVPDGEERLRVVTSGGRVSLPDAALEVGGLALDAGVGTASGLPRGHLVVETVRDTGASPRFPRLGLRGDFAPADGVLSLDGTLSGLGGRLRLTLRGVHDPAKGGGRADLALAPVTLKQGGLSVAELLPSLASQIQGADGRLEASGEVRWSGGALDGFLDVAVRDLSLQTAAATFDRVNAAVHVEGPWPPRIAPGQLVSMARLDFGLELTDGLVRYALRPGGVLAIEAAEWHFAGGTIRSGGVVDLAAREKHVVLTVRNVDLAQLLALVNLEGLSGTGRLDGVLPLHLVGDSIEIRDAILEAPAEGGWIRYAPRGEARAVASAAGLAFGDLLEALRNFHYERLRLTVNGRAEDSVVVALSLLGANPEHRDGQPYEFNLNVDGRLGDLVRQSGAAYRIPARIEEQLSRIAAGAR